MRSRFGIIRSAEANRDLANTGTWLFRGLKISEDKTSEIHRLAAPALTIIRYLVT